MKVLVCGASGLIGSAVCARLAAAGHGVLRGVRRAVHTGDVAIDYSSDLSASDWLARLHGVDAVVNAVGIIAERGDARFDTLHTKSPAALFAACAAAGVRRVVQVSALGAAEGDTAYFTSKRAADEALMALPLEWTVLRPSLVFGGASSAMFCKIASLPLLVTPALDGALFAPVHVDDVAHAVLEALDPATPARRVVDLAGSRAAGFDAMLATYRRSMGLPPAPVLHIPAPVMSCAAWIGKLLPGSLLTPDTWRMLRAGSAPATAAGTPSARRSLASTHLDGRLFRAMDDFIAPADAELVRLRALAAWRGTMLRWVLAVVWLATALVSAFIYPPADSLAMLARVGIVGPLAGAALYGAAALDAAFGIATIARPSRALWAAQAALVLGYSLAIAVRLPEFLWHPFGPLLKNLPILALLLILYSEEKPWTT